MPPSQVILFQLAHEVDPMSDTGPLGPGEPMGSPREVLEMAAPYNTAPDGTVPTDGMTRLHGPGFVGEFNDAVDPVTQILVTLLDADIAWPVLSRMCRAHRWKLLDPESGRTFL